MKRPQPLWLDGVGKTTLEPQKIGSDVAVEALRDYRRVHPKRLEAVWRFAETDRVTRVIRPYLEAVG